MPSCIRVPPAAENRIWGAFARDSTGGSRNDGIADIHAHGATHEAEILGCRDDRRASHFALTNQHRFCFTGCFLRGLHAVGVALLIAELQRIEHGFRHLDFGVDPAIEQAGKPSAGLIGIW